MSFEEAAAIPQAGALAVQPLLKVRIQPGMKVLVNGAGGGVGTFAVQLARHFGAEVTAVDCAEKLDRLRSLGADTVVDYRLEDITKRREQYDFILDVIAHRSLLNYKRIVKRGGTYLMVGGTTSRILQAMLFGPLISRLVHRNMRIWGYKPNKDLDVLITLMDHGKVRAVVDTAFPLEKAAEGFRYFGSGRFFGKIVFSV